MYSHDPIGTASLNIGGISIRNDFFKKPYEGDRVPGFIFCLSLANLSVILGYEFYCDGELLLKVSLKLERTPKNEKL